MDSVCDLRDREAREGTTVTADPKQRNTRRSRQTIRKRVKGGIMKLYLRKNGRVIDFEGELDASGLLHVFERLRCGFCERDCGLASRLGGHETNVHNRENNRTEYVPLGSVLRLVKLNTGNERRTLIISRASTFLGSLSRISLRITRERAMM